MKTKEKKEFLEKVKMHLNWIYNDVFPNDHSKAMEQCYGFTQGIIFTDGSLYDDIANLWEDFQMNPHYPHYKYMIRCYSRTGKHIKTVYTDSLKDAEKIRLNHAKKNNITDFPFFPTIWKWTGNDYKRMPGY